MLVHKGHLLVTKTLYKLTGMARQIGQIEVCGL